MATTPVNTATAAGAAAVVAPVVAMLNERWKLQLPADVQASIVVGIVAGAHWIGQQAAAWATRVAAKKAAKPS